MLVLKMEQEYGLNVCDSIHLQRKSKHSKGTKGEPALKPLMLFPRLKTNLFTLKD